MARPTSLDRITNQIMVLDFSYGGKRYLDDFPARAFYFDTGGCQGLRGFHALDDAADSLAVDGDDLNIVFAVERLEGRQGFSNFHF